jgi:hypothetical protein
MLILNMLLDFVIIALFTCPVIYSMAVGSRQKTNNIASIVYGRVVVSRISLHARAILKNESRLRSQLEKINQSS